MTTPQNVDHHHINNNNNNNDSFHHHHHHHTYNSQKDQALLLDIDIVQTLLHRNHASHGRTMYYRRTQRALHHVTKTIQHVAVTSSSSSSTTNNTTLFHDWNIDYHQRIKQQQQLHRLIVRLHPQQQQHEPNKKDTTTTMAIFKILESLWLELTLPFPNTTNTTSTSILSNVTTGTTTTNSHSSNSTIRLFQHCIFYDLPNCITRIEQAFARGHMELIRGFFLSLLTILLSGLARIHVVLLQLQSTMIVQSIQYLSQLQ